MISFVIPAHNEELWIGKCISSTRVSMEALREPYEIIVVDDASTDSTAQLAEQAGARVVHVTHRQISATRNSGAREANGEILFFVDADTQANEAAIRASLDAMRSGAVGGGCVFKFDCPLPLFARILYPIGVAMGRMFRLTGGCFLFCTRPAFDAIGGFPEKYYAAEEVDFVQGLKRLGHFVIPKPTVITSGRKLPLLGFIETIRLVHAVATRAPILRDRDKLDIFYGERARVSRK